MGVQVPPRTPPRRMAPALTHKAPKIAKKTPDGYTKAQSVRFARTLRPTFLSDPCC
jgi:hypothetical protein